MAKYRWVKIPSPPGTEVWYGVKIRDMWKQDVALILLVGILGLIVKLVFF